MFWIFWSSKYSCLWSQDWGEFRIAFYVIECCHVSEDVSSFQINRMCVSCHTISSTTKSSSSSSQETSTPDASCTLLSFAKSSSVSLQFTHRSIDLVDTLLSSHYLAIFCNIWLQSCMHHPLSTWTPSSIIDINHGIRSAMTAASSMAPSTQVAWGQP